MRFENLGRTAMASDWPKALSSGWRHVSIYAYRFAKATTHHLHPLSRGFRAWIFLIYGFAKVVKFNSTAALMATVGMPLPKLFLTAAISIELICGLALFIGYRTRETSLILTLYLIPVTLVMHGFRMFVHGMFVQEQNGSGFEKRCDYGRIVEVYR
ncbi:MAG TPA: DoxX family protein [Blastocatellia bacterium]|nr:DoxX family protein [Blastocatellia bacterium]